MGAGGKKMTGSREIVELLNSFSVSVFMQKEAIAQPIKSNTKGNRTGMQNRQGFGKTIPIHPVQLQITWTQWFTSQDSEGIGTCHFRTNECNSFKAQGNYEKTEKS